MHLRLAFILGILLATGGRAAETPHPATGRLPVETLFAAPDLDEVQISPDGSYVSFLTTLGTGRVGIALMRVADGRIEPLVGAKDEDYRYYVWKGPNHVVFGGDIAGNESLALRSISIADRKVVQLAESNSRAWIPSTLPLDPDHIVIGWSGNESSLAAGLFRVDVGTKEKSRITSRFDVAEVWRCTLDHQGVTRVRERRDGKNQVVEVTPDRDTEFTTVARMTPETALLWPEWQPVGFAADNDILYVVTRDRKAECRFRAYITSRREFAPEPYFVMPGEFEDVIMAPDHSRALGIRFMAERPGVHWFDRDRAALQASIDAALPGTVNLIASTSRDGLMHVVAALSDRRPPTYFLLNLKPNAGRAPGLTLIGYAYTKLANATLQEMRLVTYSARDGLTIHGYLTLPAGYMSGQRVPLVLLIHGGPYGRRATCEYDPETQFFASRGWAVLQPNYRGSGGYGLEFMEAGRHEWGGKMQDDLTDGVKWAIAQGFADPKRIAIVGSSYGGYAALAGATLTPDLYCCAVNYVGASDLKLLTSYAEWRYDRLYQKYWIGDDAAYLRDRSPVNFVERIRIPTLHGYGKNDPRVDIEHWERLKAQLDRFKKPYEIVYEKSEGHGFRHEATRIAFFRNVDQFLSRSLQTGMPALPTSAP